jgi:hypothetical protein
LIEFAPPRQLNRSPSKTMYPLSQIEKPIIQLYDAAGLGVIVLFPSGVIYTNQTGGYSCLHPTEEGVYLPLVSDSFNHESALLDYFYKGKWRGACADGIDIEDADFIDQLLGKTDNTKFVSVNRQRLADSHEAWVYVNLAATPSRFPELPATYSSEMSFLLYGFGAREGVLTWCNSD